MIKLHMFFFWSSGCEQFAPRRVVKLIYDVRSEQRISGAGPPHSVVVIAKVSWIHNFLEVCNIFVMFC